jgi:hypothetical protein
LLTLLIVPVLAVPVGANSERLEERVRTTYTVDPAAQSLTVTNAFNLRNDEQGPYNALPWGPIIVEDAANIRRPKVVNRSSLPGPWTAIEVEAPRIEEGTTKRVSVEYALVATRDGSPIVIDDGYLYFCVIGQDADLGTIEVKILGEDRFVLTQSGTPLEITDDGLRSTDTNDPGDVFTCVEGTVDEKLVTAPPIIGPGGRDVVLQTSPSRSNWLRPAQSTVVPTLDAIAAFLGQDIPGQGTVIVRHSPLRDLGGYASAHDTPGIVQLDDDAGLRDPEHQLAHAWFGADNVTEPWLREGLAEWIATTMRDATCPAASDNPGELVLSDWQVVRPTAGKDVEQVVNDQLLAACGLVSATRERMGDEQWRGVLAALLSGDSKYNGSGGPTESGTTAIDYREWLDAVDEIGLVPAGQSDPAFAANLEDLDWAQNLLNAFEIPTDPAALEARSQARAAYHEFLATSDGLEAPLVVRQALDDWEFNAAMSSIQKSQEVLDALREADAQLPGAEFLPVIAPLFESAASEAELDEVLAQSEQLQTSASQIGGMLTGLNAELPEGWTLPAAVLNAIRDADFATIEAAIPPAVEVAAAVNAANEVLPEAGLPEKYRERFVSTATASSLRELASEVADELEQARLAGTSLRRLEQAIGAVGDWRVPAAVTQLIDQGRIEEALPVLQDALAVVEATRAGDVALPAADLAAEFRPRFESAASAADMQTLRAEATTKAAQAEAVGAALSALEQRTEWRLPPILQEPIDQRDFETAARVATIAEQWIVAAADADQKLPEIAALEKAQPLFEGATTIADLEAGAQLAADWNTAAVSVGAAIAATKQPLDLLGSLGMMGTDVGPELQKAKDAAIDGNVKDAINAAAVVNATYHNAPSVGGLRLAGIIFFFVAIVGVAGLWFLLRREAGPPWARQRKPHWLKDQNRKDDDQNPPGPPTQRAIGSGKPQSRGR